MTILFQEKSPMYSISLTSYSATSTTAAPTLYPITNPPYPVAQNSTPYSSSVSNLMSQHSAPYPNSYPDLNYQNPQPQPYGNMGGSYQPPYQPYTGSSVNNGTKDLSHSNSAFSLLNTNGAGSYAYNTVQSNHIRASLVSAVEDKIRNRLREKIGLYFFFFFIKTKF